MPKAFAKHIAPFVRAELERAASARALGWVDVEFQHLEHAHVLGQESTRWHVTTHALMLMWAARNAQAGELFGQLFRIVGAATKTVFGLVPRGNTGGSNISPFKSLPIRPELQAILDHAKDAK